MTSKEASEKIMQFVNIAKEENEKAYRSYNNKRNGIENKASNSNIDLFGGTAVYEVREIVTETREAAEEFYVSNQSLVRMLDDECKPFLVFAPYKKTVNAVSETMKKLNEDSSININFGASLNHGASNGVASVHYEPSLESKMIQKFWEQKVLVIEESPEEREILKVEREEQRKRDEENKRKEEAERKRLEDEYEAEQKRKQEEKDSLKKKRQNKVELTNKKSAEFESEAKNTFDSATANARKTIEEATKQKALLEKEISELGAFDVIKKMKKTSEVSKLSSQIEIENNFIKNEQEKYDFELNKIPLKLVKFLINQDKNDEFYYYIPVKLPQGTILNQVFDFSKKDELRHAIVYMLRENGRMLPSEIMEQTGIEWNRDLEEIMKPLLLKNLVLSTIDSELHKRFFEANHELV